MNKPTEETIQQEQLKRALAALQKMQARIEELQSGPRESIAVIGMASRMPGAENISEFWDLLKNGRDAITEVPKDRWNIDAYYDPSPNAPGKMSTRSGGFLKNAKAFDNEFFGISEREAQALDPQQRIFLEVAWEALEDAGQVARDLSGSQTGVYVGIGSDKVDYLLLQADDYANFNAYTGVGNTHNAIAGRLSYLLNLQGPSFAVDTACSSSLVALHLACQGLRNRECDLAVAGGVSLMLSPLFFIICSRMNLLSPDGRCKALDEVADGMGRGEGCGVVILKRLSDAREHGDNILAVIKGTAINHNGRSNGLAAPSELSQQEVIKKALADARVSPSEISYVELHGTGSALGDAMEIEAIKGVLDSASKPNSLPCVIGSVKTNIGHLEGAAGVSAVIKTVLALKHRLIPPHIHFNRLHPHISLAGTRFKVARQPTAWHFESKTRYAGVSSFGWTGQNAHLVLEEAPDLPIIPDEPASRKTFILPISARHPNALRLLVESYAKLLNDPPEKLDLWNLCYSASRRREHHFCRTHVIGDSLAKLADECRLLLDKDNQSFVSKSVRAAKKLICFFPDTQPLVGEAGAILCEQEPVVREALTRCKSVFQPFLDASFLDHLSSVQNPDFMQQQVLHFSLQVALVNLWREWGIKPQAVFGEGIGEITAAHVANLLTLEDAARVLIGTVRKESRLFSEINVKRNVISIYSSLTGRLQNQAEWNSRYWEEFSQKQPRLPEVVQEIIRGGYTTFLEISSNKTLIAKLKTELPDFQSRHRYLPSLQKGVPPHRILYEAVGKLYLLGWDIGWKAIYPQGNFVPLPSYPWQRKDFWFEPSSGSNLNLRRQKL